MLINRVTVATREKSISMAIRRKGTVSSKGRTNLPKYGLLPNLIPKSLVTVSKVLQCHLHQKFKNSRRVLVLLEDIALEETVDCRYLQKTKREMELDGIVIAVLLLIHQSFNTENRLFELTLNSSHRTCFNNSFTSRRM